MRILGKIKCLVRGHFFRPSCEMRYTQANWHAPMRNKRYRYACECCGFLTPWMTPKQEKLFNSLYCPTWGEFGSDSQGYRATSISN
ncbi:hypothetical protein D3C81_2141400 [compost metagenome]